MHPAVVVVLVEVDGIEQVSQSFQNVVIALEVPCILEQVKLYYQLVDVIQVSNRQRSKTRPLAPLHIDLHGYVFALQIVPIDYIFDRVVRSIEGWYGLGSL